VQLNFDEVRQLWVGAPVCYGELKALFALLDGSRTVSNCVGSLVLNRGVHGVSSLVVLLITKVYTSTHRERKPKEKLFLNYFFGFTKFKKAKIYRSAEATNPNACKMPSASPAKKKYKVASPAKTAKPDHLIRTVRSQ